MWDLWSENVTEGHDVLRVLSFSLAVSIRQGAMFIFIHLESMLCGLPKDILYHKPDKGESFCCVDLNVY